ncbi:MAG: NAD(P)/FAD-dependent oxidoreductase [Elusimicrobia bacterium]|nr:NAD(P)/FAD-dependent oxidoreductase [Elusimicrobiota bacterium]
MSQKTIVILGGGVGGLVAANKLQQLLGEQHRIILIEKESKHAFAPSFLWLMVGQRQPEQIVSELSHLVRPGIEIIHSEARQIDLANRRVIDGTTNVVYDYLIIALGARLAPEAIPGLSERAHTFYTLQGAKQLQEALSSFKAGTIAIVVGGLPYKCPGAPHEGAMLIADFFRRRGLQNEVKIEMFTPESQPMPVAGPELGNAVRQMLESKGISFHPLHKLTAVNSQGHEVSFDGKPSFHYDLLIAIPPHRPPAIVQGIGLTNEAGWVQVDCATLKTKHENVYAIGDATGIPIPGRWKPAVPLMLPKAGVFAHAQAEVVANRIASEIHGQTPKEEFCGSGYCMLEAGEELAGFAYGNFFAEPSPQIHLHRIGKIWHIGKVLFEKWWLAPFGFRREALRLALKAGAKLLGLDISL